MEKLYDLFLDNLKRTYYAENRILDALPKMVDAASVPELREAFQMHKAETRKQIIRLERVFDSIGETISTKACEGINGIIGIGEELLEKRSEIDPDVINAGLIASAQMIEHYQMGAYGTLRSFAGKLGHYEIVSLLQESLDEAKMTDRDLTIIAEGTVNHEAAAI